MLRLTLLRHAKTRDALPDEQDWDRELEPRGILDAIEMGRRLRDRRLIPTAVLASPALRAWTTTTIVAKELAIPQTQIQRDERLYLASPHVMREVVRECGGRAQHLLVVGHNPGITEFADQVSADRSLDGMPTCAVYTLEFDLQDWAALDWRMGVDAEFDYPRSG